LDIALLKFQPSQPLSCIKFGDSNKLKVGQWVISGGSPEGILQAGMISALKREVKEDRKVPALGLFGLLGPPNKSPIRAYDEVIQHDTNIETNEFGTPLVDMNGKLVGINVGHFYRGTTYAIPVAIIEQVLPDLQAGKVVVADAKYLPRPLPMDPLSRILRKFTQDQEDKNDSWAEIFKDLFNSKPSSQHGFIGVQVQETPHGVEVVKVLSGQAAEKAGVKEHDIILSVGNQKIDNVENLLITVNGYSPGETTIIVVLRNQQQQTLEITMGNRPE
jgi:S1-C subfamily serine protease